MVRLFIALFVCFLLSACGMKFVNPKCAVIAPSPVSRLCDNNGGCPHVWSRREAKGVANGVPTGVACRIETF